MFLSMKLNVPNLSEKPYHLTLLTKSLKNLTAIIENHDCYYKENFQRLVSLFSVFLVGKIH